MPRQNRSEHVLDVKITDSDMNAINTAHDAVIRQMLIDAANENDEPLRIIRSVFNPGTPIVKFDVDDSVILKLMFDKKT